MAKLSKGKEKDSKVCEPCIYAGDKEDEFCSECTGVTMEIGGKVFPCTECEGYTIVEEEQEPQEVVAVKEDVKDNSTPVASPSDLAAEQQTPDNPCNYTSCALTTAIKAESGVSIELKDKNGTSRWYRFGFTEERLVPETADMQKEKELLWDSVNSEVDKQIDDVVIFLNSK